MPNKQTKKVEIEEKIFKRLKREVGLYQDIGEGGAKYVADIISELFVQELKRAREEERERAIKIVNDKVMWARDANPDEVYKAIAKLKNEKEKEK